MDINPRLLKFFEGLEEEEDSGSVDTFPEPGHIRGILKLLPAMFSGFQVQNLQEPEFDDDNHLEKWYADKGQKLYHFRTPLKKLFRDIPKGLLDLLPADTDLDVRVISDDAHERTYYEIMSVAWGNHVLREYAVTYENGVYTQTKNGHTETNITISV